MKFGLIIYGGLEALSGGYLYDRKLVEHLERCGDSVQVISLPWRDYARYARHLADNLSPSLLSRLERLDVDVLLEDELNHPSLIWVNRRLKQRRIYPIVSIVHHLRSGELRPVWQNRFYRLVERFYLRSVDGFVFNSRTTRAAVEALAGNKRPGVVAFPAADHLTPQIDPGEIVQRARMPGPVRLLFVGNLIRRKGLHTLLSALSELPENAFTLDIVGSMEMDAGYAAAIRRQIATLHLEPTVRLHGTLGEAELVAQFRRANALVLPSSYEGFGIVYLEGMSFGLPAIATTAGAAGEIIDDGQTGLLVPPEDPQALAACLRRLAADRELLVRMSLAARQRYDRHPNWEQTAAKIRDYLLTFT
jgi:glycosyltransferase involved in cell wall biosynthesis